MNTKDIQEIQRKFRVAVAGNKNATNFIWLDTLVAEILTKHHEAEVEKAVEEERERIRVFVANNYRIDYVNPAIDLEVIMEELEPLPKTDITSDK